MLRSRSPISQKGGFKSRYIGARKLSAGRTKPWNRNETTTSVHLVKSTIISKLLHSMHSQAIEEAFFHSQDSYIIACQERGSPPLFLFLFRHSPFLPPSFRSTLSAAYTHNTHIHTERHTQLRLEGSSKRRPVRVYTFSFDRFS